LESGDPVDQQTSALSGEGKGRVFWKIAMLMTNYRYVQIQGRLRPFPREAVLGPTFTSGDGRGRVFVWCQARSRASWASRIPARAMAKATTSRTPVNRRGENKRNMIGGRRPRKPGVNAGPITAYGGNARERASMGGIASGQAIADRREGGHFLDLKTDTARRYDAPCRKVCPAFGALKIHGQSYRKKLSAT
jgi:hypothetical protein